MARSNKSQRGAVGAGLRSRRGSRSNTTSGSRSWQNWRTKQRMVAVCLVLFAAVTVGAVGYFKNHQNNAQAAVQDRDVYVWATDVNIHSRCTKYSSAVSNTGTQHWITAEVQGQAFGIGSTTRYGSSYNNWWLYLPFRHGWINAVWVSHAAGYNGYYPGWNGNDEPIKGISTDGNCAS